jgi:apolipoprotein N-acyltransferase
MAKWILPLISGLFLGTSYIPFYPWAIFIVWIPLWICWIKNPDYKTILWTGILATFTFNMIGFHWIAFTAREFGHLPWAVSILVLMIFSAFSALHVPATGWVWMYLRKRYAFSTAESIWTLAVIYWVLETLWPMIFPWNMGYPWLMAKWPGVQWADVIGFQGLSFVTVSVNAFLTWVILSPRNFSSKAQVSALATFFFLLFHVFGHFKGQALLPPDKTLKVLAVQANIGNLEKAYAEKGMAYQDHILNQYFDLAKEALAIHSDVDLIALPETALPIALNEEYSNFPYNVKTKQFLASAGRPLLTGSYSEPLPDKKTHNSVFLLDEKGAPVGRYDKTLLLAFGEYIPGGDLFPILYKWLPFISHFSRGPGPGIIVWNNLKIGVQVCYEGLYPWFTTDLVDQGSQILFNATNDSWFGENFEPEQHLYMTAARAIEYRRPLLRVTNTGVTTAVLPNGQFLERSPVYKKWFGRFEIPYSSQPVVTLYSRMQPYMVPLILFWAFGIFGMLRRRKLA